MISSLSFLSLILSGSITSPLSFQLKELKHTESSPETSLKHCNTKSKLYEYDKQCSNYINGLIIGITISYVFHILFLKSVVKLFGSGAEESGVGKSDPT